MAQQIIELGELPGGLGGDTNRSANVKCNENFTELYETRAMSGVNDDITELAGLTKALSVEQGGTGFSTDDDLLKKLLTAGLYNKEKAVGAVSPVAGVGALMQRGENANGEYVKYADGTMICTRHILDSMAVTNTSNGFYFSPTGTWNYPFAFVNKEPFVGSLAIASGITLSTPYALTLSGCQYYVVACAPLSGQQYRIKLVAIGRWF